MLTLDMGDGTRKTEKPFAYIPHSLEPESVKQSILYKFLRASSVLAHVSLFSVLVWKVQGLAEVTPA